MSIAVMNWVWANSPTSGNERLVLLALADACSRDDGTGCWPSAATTARKANISDRTVRRVIARLEAEGQVIVHRGGGPTGSTKSYTVVTGDRVIHSPGQNVTPDKLSGGDTGDMPPRTQPCQGTPDIAASPDPPENDKGTAATPAREVPAAGPRVGCGGTELGEFFEQLAARNQGWLLTAGQRKRLAPAVTEALAAGWTPDGLAKFAGGSSAGIRNPVACSRPGSHQPNCRDRPPADGHRGAANATSAPGCWTSTATHQARARAARPAALVLPRSSADQAPVGRRLESKVADTTNEVPGDETGRRGRR